MTEQNKSAFKICLNFGLLIGAAFILTSYIYFQKGAYILLNPEIANVNYMLCISGLFIAIRKLKSDLLPDISFWQTVLAGSLTIGISAIPYSIYMYFMLAAAPEMISNAILVMEKGLLDANYSSEQASMITNVYNAFANPGFWSFTELLRKLFMGLFFSFILSSFLSKRKYLPKSNNSTNFDKKEQ
jgi:hypothetical protein